jgi:hypothetical protein
MQRSSLFIRHIQVRTAHTVSEEGDVLFELISLCYRYVMCLCHPGYGGRHCELVKEKEWAGQAVCSAHQLVNLTVDMEEEGEGQSLETSILR